MKNLIFCGGFLLALPAGVLAASTSTLCLDLVFVALVFGTAVSDRLDINFLSHEWYRGTTRGIEFSFVDILALTLLISVLIVRNRSRLRVWWPPSLGWLLAYFAYCCFNVAISEPRVYGLFELAKILRGIVVLVAVAYYVRSEREVRRFLLVLAAAMVFEAVVGLRERYLLGAYRVSGTLVHPNLLSMYCLIALPLHLSVTFSHAPRWLRFACGLGALAAAVCIILSISRTGFAGLAMVTAGVVATCAGLRFTPRNLAIIGCIALVAGAMLFKSWDSLSNRFQEATVEREFASEDVGRGSYWFLARNIVRDHFLGVGLNNWSYWVSAEYGARAGMDFDPYPGVSEFSSGQHAPPAHTLIGITLGELGWAGLVLLCGVFAQWSRLTGRFLFAPRDSLLAYVGVGGFFSVAAILLQSLTEWEFRATQIYLLSHIVVGIVVGIQRYREQVMRAVVSLEMRPPARAGRAASSP